jgi:hypothetical protein
MELVFEPLCERPEEFSRPAGQFVPWAQENHLSQFSSWTPSKCSKCLVMA